MVYFYTVVLLVPNVIKTFHFRFQVYKREAQIEIFILYYTVPFSIS